MRGTIAAMAVAAACLCAPANAFAQEDTYDPLESFNRRMFGAHEAIDKAVLEPVARGYRTVTTEPVRNGVSNFLHNLRSPVIFVNDVLQGEVRRAGVTALRFGVNSTVGILGVFDPADDMGLEPHDEDFGQTLAVWGLESGPYLFVPLLGPTNLRDGTGRIIDIAFDPLSFAEFDGDDAVRISRTVVTGVAAREDIIEEVEVLRADSMDPYVSIRTSYGLLRYSAVQNGRRDLDALPEFEAVPNSDESAPTAPPTTEPTEPTQQQTAPTASQSSALGLSDTGVLQ